MSYLNNISIKLRLIVLVGFLVFGLMLMSFLGLNGMRTIEHSMSELYHGNMAKIHQLNVLLEKIENSRLQALLSLQHDPASSFSKMHDHHMSMHLQQISENFKLADEVVVAFKAAHLTDEEIPLTEAMLNDYASFRQKIVPEITALLEANRYQKANEVLLQRLNPAARQLQATIEELLQLEDLKAQQLFEKVEADFKFKLSVDIAALAAFVLLSAGLAYLIVTGITRGVRQVETAARQLAEGDLGARIEDLGRNELGNIAQAFNLMSNQFQKTVCQIKDAIGQLSVAAEETSTVTAQATAGINQQLEETGQVATAMNEMNATVHEVARNAVDAAHAAKEADDAFIEGREVVNDIIQAIGDLAKEVDSAAQVIHELEEESTQIGSVLDVIKSIAEQTNLLALNAAIEAARAGEQGRGFAVVADEVRSLAARTQESTKEIEEMITRLQGGASRAVQVMVTGKGKSHIGVEKASVAGQALERINTSVESISNMNTQIASATEEQSAVAEEINQNITRINDVAEQSAAGAGQTAQASEDLSRLAVSLKQLVDVFKT